MIEADIQITAGDWSSQAAEAAALVTRAMEAVSRHESAGLSDGAGRDLRQEVTVVLGDDALVRSLNRRFRGRDEPTNVLAFPSPFMPVPAPSPVEERHLGDVVLAFETVKREAEAQNTPFDHHMSHLVVHGTLHLLGYDHVTEQDANRMEAEERAILGGLGIPDPYATEKVEEAGTVPDG